MRARCVLSAFFVSAALIAPAAAQFSGELAFTPETCRAKRSCILKAPLTFVDPAKRVWEAKAGGITDGASIPDWAEGWIGGRWDQTFLKAAVLHDYYCGAMLYSWRETHRMFYDALLALGVDQLKAKVMYYAVYVAGPKWEAAPPTKACDPASADACLMSVDPRGVEMAVRPARFGAMNMPKEMRTAEAFMARKPEASLDDLEALAARSHPEDRFLRQGRALGPAQ